MDPFAVKIAATHQQKRAELWQGWYALVREGEITHVIRSFDEPTIFDFKVPFMSGDDMDIVPVKIVPAM